MLKDKEHAREALTRAQAMALTSKPKTDVKDAAEA